MVFAERELEMARQQGVPEWIASRIGYYGWADLSFVLHNGEVQTYKLDESRREGRDIGVPETVRRMANHQEYPRVKSHKSETEFKKLLITGYLLGTDFVSLIGDGPTAERNGILRDEHGNNQLEGELKRHWARIRSIDETLIHAIRLEPKVLDDYCNTYGLDEAKPSFANKLNF